MAIDRLSLPEQCLDRLVHRAHCLNVKGMRGFPRQILAAEIVLGHHGRREAESRRLAIEVRKKRKTFRRTSGTADSLQSPPLSVVRLSEFSPTREP